MKTMNWVVHRAFASSISRVADWSVCVIACVLGTGCIGLKDGESLLEGDAGRVAANDGASLEASFEDSLEAALESQASLATMPEAGGIGDVPSSPLSVAPDHLRLWLTADHGIACSTGRVAKWEDQSGRANDAWPQYGQLGPQCDLSSHRYNGVMLPYFSAPKTANARDETLDIDLNCLVHVQYTVFVVERRWADYQDHSSSAEYVVGTTVEGLDQSNLDAGCANGAFQFGYAYTGGGPELVLDQDCNKAARAVKRVPTNGPADLSEETAEYSTSWGRALWIPGAQPAYVNDQTQLMKAYGGAIGRGIVVDSKLDTRFRGDIAEIVIYDTALDSADMAKIEKYLALHWHYMW
jgi:hypothetical protein